VSASASVVVPRRAAAADYLELTKPRITLTVVMTALVGFVMGSRGPVSFSRLAVALAGTALVAAGASALNMLLERRTDALMLRTRNRPVAAGRLRPVEALAFGLALTAAGLMVLYFGAGPLAALVALATWASYLFAYTPLKTRTSLSTLIGAIPGALPPVIGWAAATGTISTGAIVLFGIVFLWQMPHFLAIAWLYRDDYRQARIPLLPVLEPDGRRTGQQALLYAAALWPVSVLPAAIGLADMPYIVLATLLGAGLIALSAMFARARTTLTARRLFLYSIIYLPLLWIALVLDRIWI